MTFLEITAVSLTGAAVYGTLEMLWRGWTHWSMLLAGAVCGGMMYWVANFSRLPLWQEWILCAALITTVEFFSGVVLNLWLGWNIWDYSGMRINLLGQICPAFCLVWLGISIPGVWLCRFLRVLVT